MVKMKFDTNYFRQITVVPFILGQQKNCFCCKCKYANSLFYKVVHVNTKHVLIFWQTRMYTHTHVHSLSLTHTHPFTHTLAHKHTHSLTHSLTHSHTNTHTHSHTHTRALSLSYTLIVLLHIYTHSHSLFHTDTQKTRTLNIGKLAANFQKIFTSKRNVIN